MALGGGTFLTQNKILPGTYINFVSTAKASATLSERGIATIPLAMDWGPENQVMTVELGEFQKHSQKIFGYAYTADAIRPMREIFLHAKTVHFFRLNQGGKKAACAYAKAKYTGTRGNDLRIVIETNEHSESDPILYDVITYLGAAQVDIQKGVSKASELKNNDYVEFLPEAVLGLTASTPLTGGTNGAVEDSAYQTYLDQMESYTFHTMGCTSAESTITDLFVSYCKRMRDDVGKKFQVVAWRSLADYEGVVSVKNTVKWEEGAVVGYAVAGRSALGGISADTALIPWVTGVIAGTAVNQSATNMTYDGEYTVHADYTQTELEAGIVEGSFMLHRVNDKINVLEDINTFVSITDTKSVDFSSNQTVRVLDQIANDIAVLFGKKYIGKVPNDAAGRVSLWNDIVKHHTELQKIRAIENFKPENVTVQQGETKKAVAVSDSVTPVNAMSQLYMTVYVQ
ncbi:MAG: phage tail sheath family protein [Butyricicoccus pullicaecorum]|nr:phage tail sheath family protein [Butyricicoccus pullicaecorum]